MTDISQMPVMLSLDITAKRENRYSLWSYARAQAQADLLLTVPQTDPDWIVTRPPYRYVFVPRWSPDGSKVAFVAWLAERPEAYLLEFAD